MGKRLLGTILGTVVTLAALLVAPTAAQAASGGGCTGAYPISSCISYQGSNQTVVGDFYMNATPDGSRCTAYLQLRTSNNGNSSWIYYDLNRTGRFGPISRNVNVMNNFKGSAVAVVEVYTCSGAFHGTYTSPRVYYP
ncbi:hypothetical protein ACLQ25_17240 [Micromonospora sp. DT44]|uniref:hypothetical protein n=1 Tax=Micromonospora sp. DT44 TaxID=3393439 RepID=UPI003CEBDA29